ncbi:MAG: twin-arginine translocase subunit TatC [Anaerolineales bacterium]|jgi:sec-independent protein translocase protein TatC|nr:twin-arginine translocase subunit TatC [Anaerolineales bacterium]
MASKLGAAIRRLLGGLWRVLSAPFRWLLRPLQPFLAEEPAYVPLSETVQKAVANPGDVLVHLAALRGHLVRSVIVLILASLVAFEFAPQLLGWLAAPIGGLPALQAVDVTEPVGVVMRITFFSAFVVSLPYIAFEALSFVAPGLSRRSRLVGLIAIPLILILFACGALFTYYILLPPAVTFLVNFMEIPTQVRPSSYIGFATGLMFWIGLAFELPLLSFVLAAIGLLPARWLSANWRIAVVVLAIIAAAITPTVDPINMLLVWAPLVALYFLSVATALLAQHQRVRRRSQDL